MVPIRDIQTHRPLPGVEVGDIGPKFGFQAKDNGYALFKNVRIPRRNMLMRYVSVDRDGKVSLQGNPKVLYSVMMFTRLQLLTSCFLSLGKALTIGIRYGIVRKQFKTITGADGKLQERKIIDYQSHLNKLCPLLATNIAIAFSTKKMYQIYDQMMSNI